jgi:S-DNA-T family DNA segregation ATPase FtsK/SpoIIIE
LSESKTSTILAGVLSGLGALILLSILLHLDGRTDLFALPGRFLFSCFLWAAFFVPAYLLAASFFLVYPAFPRRSLLPLSLLNLPFLTMGLFFQVLFLEPQAAAVPAAWLVDLLGRFPGSLALILLAALEVLLVLRVGQSTVPRARARFAPPAGSAEAVGADAAWPIRAGPHEPAAEVPRPGVGTQTPAELEILDAVEVEEELATRPPALPPPDHLPALQAGAAAPLPEAERLDEAPAGPPEDAFGASAGGEDAPTRGRDEDAGDPAGAAVREPRSRRKREDGLPPAGPYTVPVHGLLRDYPDGDYWRIDDDTRKASEILMATLEEFKIQAEVTGIRKGPVITMFEILPAPGVKISRIVNLADNIALRLAASRVRIVAPIPGKHAVGIEAPNRNRSIVSFKEIAELEEFRRHPGGIPIILGKDIAGEPQIVDLTQTPHLLIAGATGSGKSVCVNSIICSILYGRSPAEVRFILMDPKIVELKFYNDIPHLLTPVITEPKKTFQAIQYCLAEMERRYHLLDALGVRDVRSYNRKVQKSRTTAEQLPYIVVVIDEFADLIAITGKEMESALARLAAMSRAVGIHLVLATQRPSIEVITGLIKANIPSRIAFMVASKFDSRIIIDAVGAEKLLGQGDMLFSSAWNPFPVRIQGAFLAEEEVEAITTYMKSLGQPEYIDEEIFVEGEEEAEAGDFGVDDPLLEKALEIVLAKGNASASYLQRRLKVGYNRAARLVEIMEMQGIVGPANGSKPRDILHVPDRKP